MAPPPNAPYTDDELSPESDGEEEVSPASGNSFLHPHERNDTHPREIRGIPWSSFREEFYRLLTFVIYPLNAVVSSILLAARGFVLLGANSTSTVMCYFCNAVINVLGCVEDIDRQHSEVCCDCPMVNGASCDNDPMETRYPEDEKVILSKLETSRKSHRQSASVIERGNSIDHQTRSGPDRKTSKKNFFTRVDFSSLVILLMPQRRKNDVRIDSISQRDYNNFTHGNNIRHQTHTGENNCQRDENPRLTRTLTFIRPDGSVYWNRRYQFQQRRQQNMNEAPHSLDADQENIQHDHATIGSGDNPPTQEDIEFNEDVADRPKRPEFARFQNRLRSFDNWPRQSPVEPESLARAGFFYAGYSDCARCFHCGCGLRNWEPASDVWIEHARWFPQCGLVRHEVGREFATTLQTMDEEQRRASTGIDEGGDDNTDERLEGGATGPQITITYDDVLERMRTMGVGNAPLPLDREPVHRLICKTCKEKEANIIFWPCRHLVVCEDCSKRLWKCPVCKQDIKGVATI